MHTDHSNRLKDFINKLGPWFHNLHLPGGVQTAPDHFLGDFPLQKWRQLEAYIPKDLSGWNVLDIGCNAGFYSFELAIRGAQVLGIDSDLHYLNQARWIAKEFYPENPPRFEQLQIHELARLDESFDLVLFMGVFYHLRYPQLALDTIASKVKRMMIFQTLTMNGESVFHPEPDYPIMKRDIFDHHGWPKMSFIEHKFSNDETNWWVPNHAAVEALLRSSGFSSIERIGHEMYIAQPPPEGMMNARTWDQGEWEAATGVRRGGLPS